MVAGPGAHADRPARGELPAAGRSFAHERHHRRPADQRRRGLSPDARGQGPLPLQAGEGAGLRGRDRRRDHAAAGLGRGGETLRGAADEHLAAVSLRTDGLRRHAADPASRDGACASPRAWAHLRSYEAALRGRERGRFDDAAWWRFGRHQNLDKQDIPKLLVPRLVKRLRASFDAAGRYYLDNVDVGGVIPAARRGRDVSRCGPQRAGGGLRVPAHLQAVPERLPLRQPPVHRPAARAARLARGASRHRRPCPPTRSGMDAPAHAGARPARASARWTPNWPRWRQQ